MKKALVLSGGWDGHIPEKVAEIYQSILEEVSFEGVHSNSLEVLDDLNLLRSCDVVIPNWTMGDVTDERISNLVKAVAEGTGIAGCHGGMCDAFRSNTDYQFMTGANWVAHPGNSTVEYMVNIVDGSSPLTKGIVDFSLTSEQYYMHIDPAINVLATTTFQIADGNHSPNCPVVMPQVWTKMWGVGRVFYSAIGHTPEDMKIPEAYELLKRGILWAAEGRSAVEIGE